MYVGQKVVCIDTSSSPGPGLCPSTYLAKGEIYTVIGVSNCVCGLPLVDVGLASGTTSLHCCRCGRRWQSSIWWVRASRFAPVEDISDFCYDDAVELISEPCIA